MFEIVILLAALLTIISLTFVFLGVLTTGYVLLLTFLSIVTNPASTLGEIALWGMLFVFTVVVAAYFKNVVLHVIAKFEKAIEDGP